MVKEKIKVLVLGGQGLLGHAVYRFLKRNDAYEVMATHRVPTDELVKFDGYSPELDLKAIYQTFKFDWVINAVGILQHSDAGKEDFNLINTMMPKTLAKLTRIYKFNLIHISTDAVFPKEAGPVDEESRPNPQDLYGKSKLAGEVIGKSCLTIRTSVIGLDPYHHRGLLEWALTKPQVNGFTNHNWSGATNWQLAQFIHKAINQNLIGLVHFATLGPTTKYDLLQIWLKLFPEKKIKIVPVEGPQITRYLVANHAAVQGNYTNDINQALKEIIKYEDI